MLYVMWAESAVPMHVILVVEDQPELCMSIQMTLELAGYQVFTAGTGVGALETLRVQTVDLIVSDIGMPQLDGYQLCRLIRADRRWHTIPLLFLTARGTEED